MVAISLSGPWGISRDDLVAGLANPMASPSHRAGVDVAMVAKQSRVRALTGGLWAMSDEGFDSATDPHIKGGNIGILPMRGVLLTHAVEDWFFRLEGFDSLKRSGRAMISLGVTTIILVVGSRGGHVQGAAEMAAEIRGWKKMGIDVFTVIDVDMLSAAYWVGSQADTIYATPSTLSGNMGIYLGWDDITEALTKQGIRNSYISEGTYKTAQVGDDTERNRAEQDRDREWVVRPIAKHFYEAFLSDVEAGRGKRLTAEKARAIGAIIFPGLSAGPTGDTAIEAGLVDSESTLDELLKALGVDPVSEANA